MATGLWVLAMAMATGLLLSLGVWLMLGVWLHLLAMAMGLHLIRVLARYLAGARSCWLGVVDWGALLLGLFALDCQR